MLVIVQIVFLYLLLAAFVWLLIRKKAITLSLPQILASFGFQVMMGCLHGLFYSHYYPNDDTFFFNQLGIEQYNKLLHSPGQFFKEIIPLDSFSYSSSITMGFHYLFDQLQLWMIAKPLAFFNFLSHGNYYINVALFSFFLFWGPYLLYKLFVSIYPERKSNFFLASFFIPFVIFWTASLRSDGLILLALAIVLYYFSIWIRTKGTRPLLKFLLGIFLLIILRNALVFSLAPALVAWWLTKKYSWKASKTFLIAYGVTAILFFLTGASAFVANRQHEFLQLHGTAYSLDTLSASPASYISIFPQAFANAFAKPFPWKATNAFQWAMVIELLFFWVLALLAFYKRRQLPGHPITWVALWFGFTTILLIGYTVPYPGTFVRYRAIPECLLMIIFISPYRLKKYYIF